MTSPNKRFVGVSGSGTLTEVSDSSDNLLPVVGDGEFEIFDRGKESSDASTRGGDVKS
jgi:hypothetical protein